MTVSEHGGEMDAKTISIIGCGKLGKALGLLLTEHGGLTLLDVLNRTLDSARQAAAFIGAGRPVASYAELRRADLYLIATGDDQIAGCCDNLARAGLLSAGAIVFHCSGALGSDALRAAREQGAAVASIHPIRSFSAPEQATADFAGTWCGAEGDLRALDVLNDKFAAIGARVVQIDAASKILYHCAAVFASNYLVTLLDVASDAYVKSGIPKDTALELMGPLVRNTVENVLRMGPERALTGPIARGDMETALKQYRAVAEWNADYAALYKLLGKLTADLARQPRPPFE